MVAWMRRGWLHARGWKRRMAWDEEGKRDGCVDEEGRRRRGPFQIWPLTVLRRCIYWLLEIRTTGGIYGRYGRYVRTGFCIVYCTVELKFSLLSS